MVMARFYFHLRSADELAQDDEGLELPDLAAAREQAIASAREIVADAIKAGKTKTLRHFVIADENGREILTVPLKDVVPKHLC
jgi:hypothetical protein